MRLFDNLLGMQSNGGGHVIGLVGLAGTAGEPYGAGYAASKFAMMGLLKSLKYEVIYNPRIHYKNNKP